MIFAAIVAGGIGKRMGDTVLPKQFMEILDKPIIIHTLEKFLVINEFDYIIVGVHKDFNLYLKDLFVKFNINDKRVLITDGGLDRNSTIMNIVEFIEEKISIGEKTDTIVTHDAVRPFVTARIIEENIKIAKEYGACNTVIEAFDTIVQSDENRENVISIPERNSMFLGQTPQSFDLYKLKKFYNNLTDLQKQKLTDACKIFILNNHCVKLIKGELTNIKITTINDIKIARTFLE